jgi:hypothetical protein
MMFTAFNFLRKQRKQKQNSIIERSIKDEKLMNSSENIILIAKKLMRKTQNVEK